MLLFDAGLSLRDGALKSDLKGLPRTAHCEGESRLTFNSTSELRRWEPLSVAPSGAPCR